MGFSPDFLEEVRGRVPLAGVISRRVQLKKRGREYLGLCPFHSEKTPSFTVSEEKGFFHCFGCGAHGDVIEFVMRAEGLAFPEAVERLAGEAGMPLPVQSEEERERERERQSLYDVVEAACAWFERRLEGAPGRAALEYLKRRGLDEAIIARFRLGFAPDSRRALKAALCAEGAAADGRSTGAGKAQRIPEAALIAAGLLIRPEDGGASYDRFRGRVIFPITDRRGRVIAFGGRALGDGTPKYLNSPDTPLFHKGRVLYGFAAARKAAFEAGEIIVTEGYMDVIALHRAGFANAVAPLGTALTEEQIKELWRAAPEPTLCFDGDEAGVRAAAAAAERVLPLLKPGLSLRFASLPAGEDPDSLIGAGRAPAMREILDRARPLADIVWEIQTAGRALDTPERRASLRKRLNDLARGIPDAGVRDEYFRDFRKRIDAAFGPGPRRGTARRHPAPQDAGRGTKTRLDTEALLQKALLATLISHPGLLDEVGEELGSVEFGAPELDRLRQDILEVAANPALDTAGLKSHLIAKGHSGALQALRQPDVRLHSEFARPGASIESVRAWWTQAFGRCRLSTVHAQVQEAQKACGENPTSENAERLKNLKKYLHEVQAAVSGTDEVVVP